MKKSNAVFFGLCLSLAIVSLPAAPAGAENTAKGKLTVDGKTVEIKYAYAHPHKYLTDDKEKPLVEVLLCDVPLPAAAVTDTFARMDLVSAGKAHCVINAISSGKKLANFEIAHKGLKMEAAAVVNSRSHLFEPKTMDAKTVSGRVRTSSQQKGKFSDAVYSYDITFSADMAIPQSKKVGKKIQAGGGDLWKAYLAHNKKVKSMDIKEMRKAMPKDEAGNMTDKDLKALKELAVAMLAKNPNYTEGYVNGDKGVIFITDHAGKEKRYGSIDMKNEKGEWVVEKENWSDHPAE